MLKYRELLYALIAMIFISLFYFLVQTSTRAVPTASSFWGHSLGVLGFLLSVPSWCCCIRGGNLKG